MRRIYGGRKYNNWAAFKPESMGRLYSIWYDMKRRCYNSKNKRYKNYGGAGITVCSEWLDSFQAFYDWSALNGYNDKLTIDRINRFGNYSPDNCRWATKFEQANNKSNNHWINYNGEIHTMMEWSKIIGINYSTLRRRVNAGWDIKKAFTRPLGRWLK